MHPPDFDPKNTFMTPDPRVVRQDGAVPPGRDLTDVARPLVGVELPPPPPTNGDSTGGR